MGGETGIETAGTAETARRGQVETETQAAGQVCPEIREMETWDLLQPGLGTGPVSGGRRTETVVTGTSREGEAEMGKKRSSKKKKKIRTKKGRRKKNWKGKKRKRKE